VAFRILLHKGAKKALAAVPKHDRIKIAEAINGLAEDPWPDGVHKKHLQGPLNAFVRIRCGNYRIAYEIRRNEVVVMVLVIGDRREIYRLLEEFAK